MYMVPAATVVTVIVWNSVETLRYVLESLGKTHYVLNIFMTIYKSYTTLDVVDFQLKVCCVISHFFILQFRVFGEFW